MYKVFSGKKCIILSEKEPKGLEKGFQVLQFSTTELLHKGYKQFVRSSKYNTLLVLGKEDHIWNVFQSLFSCIEAAGGVVYSPKRELLMIYRNKHWDLPKGKMEKGESPEQTAVREIEEECGIKELVIKKPLESTYHIFFQDKRDCIKRTYWFEMTSKDTRLPTPQKEEGILIAKWMKKEELKKEFNKVYPSLIDVISATSFV